MNRIVKKNKGFSLIEMLVATLIFSLGLMGIAGLQTLSLRNNNNAYLRTQANLMAYDIVDSMRANRNDALDNKYNIAMGSGAPGGTSLAESDLALWLNNLARVLPEGDGAVACDDNNVCEVTVQWREITDAADTMSIVLSTEI